jgi:ABC-type phosphate transport system permease subunit
MISRVDAGVIVTCAILSSERVAGEVATVLVKGVNEFDEPPTEAEVGVGAE